MIGDLVTLPFVATERAAVDDGHRADDADSPRSASPFTDQACHHTALLRTPNSLWNTVKVRLRQKLDSNGQVSSA